MTLEEFRKYAETFNVIPVFQKFIADSETQRGGVEASAAQEAQGGRG